MYLFFMQTLIRIWVLHSWEPNIHVSLALVGHQHQLRTWVSEVDCVIKVLIRSGGLTFCKEELLEECLSSPSLKIPSSPFNIIDIKHEGHLGFSWCHLFTHTCYNLAALRHTLLAFLPFDTRSHTWMPFSFLQYMRVGCKCHPTCCPSDEVMCHALHRLV